MTSPRILVLGYSDVGHACLQSLLDAHLNVICLITHADNPNEHLWFPSVRALAEQHGVPVWLDPDLKSSAAQERVRAMAPDLLLSFYYRNMIPSAVLKIPKLGAVNMHGSYLPDYRGRAPVNWAIVNGETQTGATLHEMVAKADAGDIVDQEKVSIGPDDTAADVQSRVTKAAVQVLQRQISNLLAGTAPRTPQNLSEGRTFGRRTPEDGHLNWSQPAQTLHNLVRAVTHPYPGAFGKIRGVKTFVWKTRLTETLSAEQKPGDLVFEKGRLKIACGDRRGLEILRIQTDGQAEMDGAEWARLNLTEKQTS